MQAIATLSLLAALSTTPVLANDAQPSVDAPGPVLSTQESGLADIELGCADAHSVDSWTITVPRYTGGLVVVEGGAHTDLDFDLFDSRGNLVARDWDLTSIAFLEIPASFETTYELRVSNLGAVPNCYTVELL